MRKIVTKGLYTFMEGIVPGTERTGNAEMNEPLKQDKSKSPEVLWVDGQGNDKGIARYARTAPATYEELACHLKFTAWHRAISHRNQCQAALLSEIRKSGLIDIRPDR